jgi:PAS domain S-box-containing protein
VFTLQGADHRYRRLVETMNEGAAVVRPDGLIVYCNSRFASMLERPHRRLLGVLLTDLVRNGSRDRVRALVERAQTGTARAEVEMITGRAATIPVYLSATPNDADETPGISIIATDLTEQQQHARVGAAERLAASQIARMKPDGGVLYLMTGGQAVVSATDRTLSYDVLRDFDFIAIVTRFPFVFTVAPESRFKTIQAYIDEAKRRPNELTYGTSGVGSTLHMAMELLLSQTGAKMTHVPYRGSNPALTDIMGGQVQVLFDNMPSSIELIKGGKIRALGVTTEKRASYFPDLPTVAETVPGYEASAWFGMGVKAGTPPDIIATLNKLIEEALADPKIKQRIADLGGAPMGGTPEDFGKIIASETAKWKKVVEFSGASVE